MTKFHSKYTNGRGWELGMEERIEIGKLKFYRMV